jgi:hypothetical protein
MVSLLMSSGRDGECVDQEEECPQWAREGECEDVRISDTPDTHISTPLYRAFCVAFVSPLFLPDPESSQSAEVLCRHVN